MSTTAHESLADKIAADLRPGDVVRYTPHTNWCRDGIAIAKERGSDVRLFDTYWVGDQTCVAPESYEVLFNLSDYEVKRQYEWETYAPADRRLIGKQHGCYPLFLVRKGSAPDLGTQIENARERVSEAEAAVASAQRSLAWERQELSRLEATSL